LKCRTSSPPEIHLLAPTGGQPNGPGRGALDNGHWALSTALHGTCNPAQFVMFAQKARHRHHLPEHHLHAHWKLRESCTSGWPLTSWEKGCIPRPGGMTLNSAEIALGPWTISPFHSGTCGKPPGLHESESVELVRLSLSGVRGKDDVARPILGVGYYRY
jgi:hypothetical protein